MPKVEIEEKIQSRKHEMNKTRKGMSHSDQKSDLFFRAFLLSCFRDLIVLCADDPYRFPESGNDSIFEYTAPPGFSSLLKSTSS